ncbi:TPA: hypothetical protein HA239_01540 [Candidatus Woesearchaeota archaeon]|nr:hypothetical protein [Candidatus Woesearchaeota archaeon]HIH41076.1 hypothetical protein [Candidatus Woesearchaeota archaeon]
MKKITIILIMILTLIPISYSYGDGHDDFSVALEIIESQTPCEDLNDTQFEFLGDYYMEQMHPGEAHERMDEMMGGEGSESLRIVHINMGKNFYCKESSGFGMMGGNMMQGMMGNFGYASWGIITIFYIILLAGLIILVYFWIIRLWKNTKNRRRKK